MAFIDVNSTDDLDRARVTDIIEVGIISGSITVGASSIEAKVGANRLENRKSIIITNLGNGVLYWGDSSVAVNSGTPIYKNQDIELKISANVAVYLISTQSNTDVRIVEMA